MIVRVQEQQKLSTAAGDAGVAGDRRAGIRLADDLQAIETRRYLRHPQRRTIVDYDHLIVGQRLALHRRERFSQELRLSLRRDEAGDDDRDERGHGIRGAWRGLQGCMRYAAERPFSRRGPVLAFHTAAGLSGIAGHSYQLMLVDARRSSSRNRV